MMVLVAGVGVEEVVIVEEVGVALRENHVDKKWKVLKLAHVEMDYYFLVQLKRKTVKRNDQASKENLNPPNFVASMISNHAQERDVMPKCHS